MTHLVLTVADWLNTSLVVDFVRDIAAWVKRERFIRQTINELNQLSDAELRDIGISRGMIHSVAMEAYFDNQHGTETNKNLRGWV